MVTGRTPRRAPTTARGWLQLARRQRNAVHGSYARPARALLGLTPAEMASRLGVSDEVYARWEADEESMSGRSFGRLLRLLQESDRLAEYMQTVFAPLIEAELGRLHSEDIRQVTRGVSSSRP